MSFSLGKVGDGKQDLLVAKGEEGIYQTFNGSNVSFQEDGSGLLWIFEV